MVEPPQASAAEREVVRLAARSHAFDWYLAALLAPRHARNDLVAFAAYAGETARIGMSATEPALGVIRLQWWRDAIENAGEGGRTGSPVVDGVLASAHRLAIPVDLLLSQLTGREYEFDADGIPDEAAFDAYLDETWGSAFRLATRALGCPDGGALATLCNRAAGAYGRARVALDLPRYLAHGRLPLPASRLAAGDPRTLPPAEARAAAEGLVKMLAGEARDAIARARGALRAAPREVLPAFLPLALVEPYFRALQASAGDPARDIADISALTRVARLWLAKLRASV